MNRLRNVQGEANLKFLTVTAADTVEYEQPVPVGAVLSVEVGTEPTALQVVVLWDDEQDAATVKRYNAADAPRVIGIVRQVAYSPLADG